MNRTKVVIRHLPPSLTLSSFNDQIDSRFSSRYSWSSFRPGKSSYKKQKHARAYINFNRPEDVIEFAEFFAGHVFVNEKGTQFKAIVEYAPFQRVPKPNARKDGREGTIYKDPEYVEFLEWISKPVENLPSADIQLEKREAERAGVQEAPIVTPLMEFIRKRRAAKSASQVGGRSRITSPGKSRSSRQISEKKKYILKGNGKSSNGKEKSAYVHVSQRENHLDASDQKEVKNDSGSISQDTTKKRILLLKGKDQEMTKSKVVATTTEASKFNQKNDASGKIIRSILLNKESRQSLSSSSEQRLSALNADKGNRPPRPSGGRPSKAISSDQSPLSSDYSEKKSADDKYSGNGARGFGRQDRRTRSRVWTPLRSSDASQNSDEFQGKFRDANSDTLQSSRGTEFSAYKGGYDNLYNENESYRQFGRRGPTHSGMDDGSSKRGDIVNHEKRVWVQKSAAGS